MVIKCYSDINREDESLRPYQQKAKKEIFDAWDEVDSVMFQMPTGTGKTRLFTSIISDINKYSLKKREAVKILIIAHRTELIDQIDKSLEKYHVPHNIIAGGKVRNIIYPVHVASIQTITNKHNRILAERLNVQFVIIDEAHHALASTYKKLWTMYPEAKRLGVTATPWRMNHQSFTDLFDKLVLSMPIKDFIRQRFLAPYKYFSLKNDSDIQKTIDGIELDRFGEYKESSMEEKMDIGSIRAQLLDSYLALAEGKKGIIYAINIAHAKHICKEYENAGYRAVSIDSKTPATERKELVDKFRRGQIDIIVNVDIFSEGFDCPDIEFIQLARPTRSLVKYLQQVGRGLRPTENKENCVILDNVGMYSRFGLPDARRHWRQHFLGKKIDEEPVTVISKGGTGKQRNVDLSEGTEDMVLIQDLNEERETIENVPSVATSSFANDFLPLFGVTLGKTTWKQAEDLGYNVEIWKNGPGRTFEVNEVDFWDQDGVGAFTQVYWLRNSVDFPPSWKDKGFSWEKSFDEWMDLFKRQGFGITISKQNSIKKYRGRDVLYAEFIALSPDGILSFTLNFDYGEDGYYASSPNSLYSISIYYHGEITEEQPADADGSASLAADSPYVTTAVESFNPVPLLRKLGYENPDFVFWQQSSRRIFECYIEDDAHYVINELSINKEQQKITRKRIGQIPLTGFMGYKLMRHSLSNLSTIRHYGGTTSEFHFDAIAKDNNITDKAYDFYGAGRTQNSIALLIDSNHSADIVNAKIKKAEFHIDIANTDIIIYRKTADVAKRIARFPQKSDFGMTLGGGDIARYLSRHRKKRLDFYIYRTDNDSIYVKVKEQDTVFIYRFNFQGKRTKRILLSKFPDVWNATFDGRHQIKNVQWKIEPKRAQQVGLTTTQVKDPEPAKASKPFTINLSVRQSTFEKIEKGVKKSISRAMKDEKMARQFFKYSGTFTLKKKITAYTPSFTKVIEDECPFVPIEYKYVEVRAEGIQRTLTKKISSISVKKSYDVDDKYNWVVVYSIE